MQTTIYIRKENEDRWNAIDDKSAFVNNSLNVVSPVGSRGNEQHPAGVHNQPSRASSALKAGAPSLKQQPVHGSTGGERLGLNGSVPLKGSVAEQQPALRQAVKAFAGDCKHPNVNNRPGMCRDCGEYTR